MRKNTGIYGFTFCKVCIIFFGQDSEAKGMATTMASQLPFLIISIPCSKVALAMVSIAKLFAVVLNSLHKRESLLNKTILLIGLLVVICFRKLNKIQIAS